ncbi:hypothetical protein BGX28_000442 [Mortierella sp. GBA30]|nr:hypothetical protein BGX28_000442 [Mortierella sp. GBA30]
MPKNKVDSQTHLAKFINPRKRGGEYFFSLSNPSELSAQDYVAWRHANERGIVRQPSALCKEWNDWMRTIKASDSNPWRVAATQTATLTKRMVKEWTLPKQASASSTSVNSGSGFNSRIYSSTSSSVSSSSPTSSSTLSCSSGSLTPGALNRMKSEFSASFNEFHGKPWLLPTGTVVDEVIYKYTMTLECESALHSFVLDQTKAIVGCFEEKDQQPFRCDFDQRDSQGAAATLPDWKQKELMRYAVAPEDLRDLLSHGWRRKDEEAIQSDTGEAERDGFNKRFYLAVLRLSALYEDFGNRIPESQSEAWYATKVWGILIDLLVSGSEWLDLKLGEVSSSASSLRKNRDRDLESRHAHGRKIDGLVLCKKTQREIGAIEAGRSDEGATGTKVLKDSRKLAKLLKDMLDKMCSHCEKQDEVRSELRVFGLLISGLRVEFVSLRYLDGRYCWLKRERTFSVPLTWDEHSIRSILVLIKEMLLLRDRMEAMTRLAYRQAHPGADDLVRELSGSARPCTPPLIHIPTLSTPKNSPKRSQESKRRPLHRTMPLACK